MSDHQPEKAQFLRVEFGRSRIDWNDDGNVTDYGWWVMLYVRGKHRARWASTRGTTRMWPRITRGGDEDCNRAVTLMLWPLGHLDVWWETLWRPAGSGLCDPCRAEIEAMDFPRRYPPFTISACEVTHSGPPCDGPCDVSSPPASEVQPACDLPFGDGYTCDLPKGHS